MKKIFKNEIQINNSRKYIFYLNLFLMLFSLQLSSSDPSKQCFTPSHFQTFVMQIPSLHWNQLSDWHSGSTDATYVPRMRRAKRKNNFFLSMIKFKMMLAVCCEYINQLFLGVEIYIFTTNCQHLFWILSWIKSNCFCFLAKSFGTTVLLILGTYSWSIELDCQLNNWFQCKDGICFTKIWGCHGVKAVWIDLMKNIVISVVTSGVTNSKKFVLIDWISFHVV